MAKALPVLGIDIAKATYQVTLVLGSGRALQAQFANTPEGFVELTRWLKRHHAPRVHAGLEATGRYGEDLTLLLHDAGHRVSVLNPAQVRAYARSQLRRTKTDAVDAAVIADFVRTQTPEPWTPPAPELRELRALVRHRDALVQARVQEANRLEALPPAEAVIQLIEAHLAFLDDQLAQVEAQIRAHIDRHPDLRDQADLLRSIPGVGPTLSALLVALNLPRFADARAVSAHAGLSPAQRQSGTSVRGRAHLSKVGDARLRQALYLPALAALRFNPVIQALAERLRARGKAKLVIVGAAMHKLLVLAYGVLKSGRPFDPDFAQKAHVTP